MRGLIIQTLMSVTRCWWRGPGGLDNPQSILFSVDLLRTYMGALRYKNMTLPDPHI